MRHVNACLRVLVLGLGLSVGALAQPAPVPAWPYYVGIIGYVKAADVNVTGDIFIPVTQSGRLYELGGGFANTLTSQILLQVGPCSTAATTWSAGLWTAPGATGANLTANGTFLGASPTTYQNKAGTAGNNYIFDKTIKPGMYLNITIPQGSAATCDIRLLGLMLP
jgi:hypothetical protein